MKTRHNKELFIKMLTNIRANTIVLLMVLLSKSFILSQHLPRYFEMQLYLFYSTTQYVSYEQLQRKLIVNKNSIITC